MLPHELLQSARLLIHDEQRRTPTQASLRRAISTAYYALFHLLIANATDRMFTGTDREDLRLTLARAFNHRTMKDAADSFANRNLRPALLVALQGRELQWELVEVAGIFSDLQRARIEADYDMIKRYERSEAQQFVALAERAFLNWKTVKNSVQADVFLASLLANDWIRR